jgi:hypothetical protein
MRRLARGIAVLTLALTPALAAQRPVSVGASVSLVEHRVTAGAGLERSSGTLFGMSVSAVLPWAHVEPRLALRAGSLGAKESPATDRDVGEVEAGFLVPVRSWLDADAGVVVRRYESTLAAQRWVLGHVGLQAHATVIEDMLSVSAGLSMMPWASVSGISRPDLAVSGHSGLTYTTGRLEAIMRYRLERFDFAARNAVRRLEQVSSLAVGVAWRMR